MPVTVSARKALQKEHSLSEKLWSRIILHHTIRKNFLTMQQCQRLPTNPRTPTGLAGPVDIGCHCAIVGSFLQLGGDSGGLIVALKGTAGQSYGGRHIEFCAPFGFLYRDKHICLLSSCSSEGSACPLQNLLAGNCSVRLPRPSLRPSRNLGQVNAATMTQAGVGERLIKVLWRKQKTARHCTPSELAE